MTDDTLNQEEFTDLVYQLAVVGSGQSALLFAARDSGLYHSRDGGKTWESAYGEMNLSERLPTLAVAIPPDFESSHTLFAGIPGGILRSEDGGVHWVTLQMPSPPPIIAALDVSPAYEQDGILFAATLEDGVLFSSNRGDRWVSWNFGLLDLNTLCLAVSPHFASDETVFVGVQSGLFRSTNGGRAWQEIELPFGFDAVLSLALSPDFAQNGLIVIGTESHGLWRSDNAGDTWRPLGEGVFTEALNAIQLASDADGRLAMLALHGGQLLASSDDGQTWHPWRTDLAADDHVIAVLAPRGLAAGAPVWVALAEKGLLALS
jgi:photosystem II stability/assembly factor-like uncharacterized protein